MKYMNKEQFWKIIDLSLQDNAEGLYQDEALKQHLETLSQDEFHSKSSLS